MKALFIIILISIVFTLNYTYIDNDIVEITLILNNFANNYTSSHSFQDYGNLI